MRRIQRLDLPDPAVSYLRRKQNAVDQGQESVVTWSRARRTRRMGEVAETLKRMSGRRERCMFCEDSRATDIEHFWPKQRFPERTFVWENLLLACAGCNRVKGTRFDLDTRKRPLLIDPTADDPWDHLFFDAHTGNITAKYDAEGNEDPKGRYTADPEVLPLNIEPVTEGRQRTHRRLTDAVVRFLSGARTTSDRGPLVDALVLEIKDHEDYGLVDWFFRREGSRELPFRRLRDEFPGTWATVQERLESTFNP